MRIASVQEAKKKIIDYLVSIGWGHPLSDGRFGQTIDKIKDRNDWGQFKYLGFSLDERDLHHPVSFRRKLREWDLIDDDAVEWIYENGNDAHKALDEYERQRQVIGDDELRNATDL